MDKLDILLPACFNARQLRSVKKAVFMQHYYQTARFPYYRHICNFLCCILLFGLTSCATDEPIELKTTKTDHTGNYQLAQAAVASSQALTMMAETEQAALTPKQTPVMPEPKAKAMQQRVSIDWSGPIAPLLEQIAKMTGYQLEIIGKQPAIPVLVDVYAHNQTCWTYST